MKMKQTSTGIVLNISEFIMTRNFWEYYVITGKGEGNKDIRQCYVIGYETEIGDVSMTEIEPYIMSRTKRLSSLMPAPGWTWLTKPCHRHWLTKQ